MLGYLDAHEWLGAVYDYGFEPGPNRRRAFDHYRKRAFDHYRKAAGGANPNAEYHVGIFYLDGIGVNRDERAAISWLRRAARHGDSTAIHVLGQCYRSGRGVAKNPQKGFNSNWKQPKKVCLKRGSRLGFALVEVRVSPPIQDRRLNGISTLKREVRTMQRLTWRRFMKEDEE